MRVTKRQLRRLIKEAVLCEWAMDANERRPSPDLTTTLPMARVIDRANLVTGRSSASDTAKDRFTAYLSYTDIWPEIESDDMYDMRDMLQKIGRKMFYFGPDAWGSTEQQALKKLERKLDNTLDKIDEKLAHPKWSDLPEAVEALNALKTVLGGL
jgi:hypothetical protein